MTHAENKVDWCLKKAEKELQESANHRGLVIVKPGDGKAHTRKAEHYLRASDYLHKGNFSDIAASTLFYCMYHCLLAIALKFGYESRNQECTFALVRKLVENKNIDFNQELLDKIASLDNDKPQKTILQLREQYQYGVDISMQENLYQELFTLAGDVLLKPKTILQT